MARRTSGGGGAADPAAIGHHAHARQFQIVVQAINKGAAPAVDGPGGRASVEIILAIYKSAETGKAVKLPLAGDPKLNALEEGEVAGNDMNPELESLSQNPAPKRGPARAVIILVCGLLATWLAAGSLGWIAPPLQRTLTWLALGTIVFLALGSRDAAVRGSGKPGFWVKYGPWVLLTARNDCDTYDRLWAGGG